MSWNERCLALGLRIGELESLREKCSEPGCEGPLIRHDESGLCQGHKLSSGLSAYEAKQKVISYWRAVTGIIPGMTKEDALRIFIRFRDNPTCNRCVNNKKIMESCTGRFICEQSNEMEVVEDGREEDGREVEFEESAEYFTG